MISLSASNAGDPGFIPGLGKSPGERNGNPLQYSCLENTMDRKAWWATALLQSSWIGGLQSMGHKELDTTEPPTLSLPISLHMPEPQFISSNTH